MWSPKQQRLAVMGANLARWNDDERYIAMRGVGCAIDKEARRPSVKHKFNSNSQFELYMSLAESSAVLQGNGERFPEPRDCATWDEACSKQTARQMAKLMAMFEEAERRIPQVFGDGALDGFAEHMTKNNILPFGEPITELGDANNAQVYRIFEGAKAWLGRAYLSRGLAPETFIIPAAVRRAAKAKERAA